VHRLTPRHVGLCESKLDWGKVTVAGERNELLEGLRIVDLAAEPAAMTGRILADLGACVIRPEVAGTDLLREAQPLGPDGNSLRFVAWSAGKISLTIRGPEDPLLRRLLHESDVVISTPGCPGTFDVDRSMAPDAAWVAVTPFGLDGPRSDWRASDLGIMASTGNLFCTGDADRPPLRCTEPASYAHGGAEAAIAVLTALASCRPQLVDVSLQEAVMVASLGGAGRASRSGHGGQRAGANIGGTREIWQCRDGYVSFGLRGGRARLANLETITRLVAEDGLGTVALTDRDWAEFDHAKTPPEEVAAISEPIAAYFARRSMTELYEIACATNLMLAPVSSPEQLVESAQLAARDFFGELGQIRKFPLRFVKTSSRDGSLAEPGARAPLRALESIAPLPSLDDASPRSGEENASCWPVPPRRRSPFGWAQARLEQAVDLVHPGRPISIDDGAWAGTRILELGSGAAGPIATRYFVEHGATVIRIESSSRPDFLRAYGLQSGSPCGLDGSDLFDSLNPQKMSVTINLKNEDGVQLFKRLVAWADAVAENFAPRALRGLGLSYDDLVAEKSDLVMVSSCIMGQTGPHRDYPGFGGQGSALAGYNFLTGWPDREPVGPFGTITDSLSPRFAATALAAGLLYRWRTGKGVHLDLSQVECAIYTLAPWLLDYDVNGRTGQRMGNRSERFVPHGVFPSRGKDRWVAIACTDDEMWKKLADALGMAAEEWNGVDGRLEDVEEIEEGIASYTRERTAEEVARTLQARGVEAVPVADLIDARGDPSLLHRGHFVELEHPCMGLSTYERNGFRMGDVPSGYDRPSPLLGQHTGDVLSEVLGLTEARLDALRNEGALD
jgi:crotonobetainyl-CoA:carnitine CoA-transferase CaiB-like acyl-CoA transferase